MRCFVKVSCMVVSYVIKILEVVVSRAFLCPERKSEDIGNFRKSRILKFGFATGFVSSSCPARVWVSVRVRVRVRVGFASGSCLVRI